MRLQQLRAALCHPGEAIRSDITGDRLPTWGTRSKEALSDKGLPRTPRFPGGQGLRGPRASHHKHFSQGYQGHTAGFPTLLVLPAEGPRPSPCPCPTPSSPGGNLGLKGKVTQSCQTLCDPHRLHSP